MRIAQFGLLLFSIGWIATLSVIFFSVGECSRTNEPIVLACLTANEIGDFLAGAFAPLAFIWLAFAVFIQARELRAQHKELSLTRKELRLSRAVAEDAKEATRAQAEEARRSGDYFKKQTDILLYEDELRRFSEAKADYESILFAERNPISNINKVTFNVKNENVIGNPIYTIDAATPLKDLRTYFRIIENRNVSIGENSTPEEIEECLRTLEELSTYHDEIFSDFHQRLSKSAARELLLDTRTHQSSIISDIKDAISKKFTSPEPE